MVFGLRYVDQILWKPGLWLLVALSIVAAGLCLANLRERGLRLPVAAAVVVFGPSIILNLLQPAIERLRVKPDELRVEQPYLARNIEMTRRAYRLDTVDVKPFKGVGELTPASLEQDSTTIKNIRLWDPRPLIATYRQLQEIRLYYDFRDVDIDRYWIDNSETQVMLSARELNIDLLAPNAQTWVNQHLKFTHGYGIVMSPVHTKNQEGLPILYIKNIPPQSDVGINVTQPGIYFGEEPDVYAIVRALTPNSTMRAAMTTSSTSTKETVAYRSADCGAACSSVSTTTTSTCLSPRTSCRAAASCCGATSTSVSRRSRRFSTRIATPIWSCTTAGFTG